MPHNKISKEAALKIIEQHLAEISKDEARQCTISDEPQYWPIYRGWPEEEAVWYVYRPTPINHLDGPQWVIVVSQETGKIWFSGYVGG